MCEVSSVNSAFREFPNIYIWQTLLFVYHQLPCPSQMQTRKCFSYIPIFLPTTMTPSPKNFVGSATSIRERMHWRSHLIWKRLRCIRIYLWRNAESRRRSWIGQGRWRSNFHRIQLRLGVERGILGAFYGKRRTCAHIYLSVRPIIEWQLAFSVDFAHAILQEHHCRPDNALFDFHALANARILELGYVHPSPAPSFSTYVLKNLTAQEQGFWASCFPPWCASTQ